MPTITLKGVPADLYERIKQCAAEPRRSLNSEIIVCLERSVKGRRIDPDTFLSRVDRLRERINLPPLTDDILRTAKEAGRP
jgi:hypothetical protein